MDLQKVQKQGRDETQEDYPTMKTWQKKTEDYFTSVALHNCIQ